MKNLNPKTIAILLFCVVQISFGANEPGFGNDLNKAASAGLFSTVNDISKVNASNDGAAISSESLVVDTKNDTLTADGGVKFKYQGLKLQAFGFKRDKNSNIVTATGDVRIEMGDGSNQARIDSQKTLLSLDSSILKYYDSISYMEVGSVTGAVAPNDRIYFGGEVGEYTKEAFTLKNAWFTTDFSILETGDYKKGGYYLETKKLKIVPDNKAEFQDIDLYISGHKVGWFPWYAVNIRQGSKVPLFPVWGDSTDYGFHISSGINYGNNSSKYFKGGIAPKFSDQLGLLVGRFENWYDLGNYGNGLITADDLLVSKKDSSIDDRWDLAANHEYKSDKGYLKLGLQSTTVNKISALEDYRDELERAGYYKNKDRNDGESINFITLDSEFKNIGERNDITLHSKVKMLAGGEEPYRQLVDDRMSDASFGSELDHKLYTDLGFTKDNEDYMFSGYYNYLKDLDPGSTSKDDDDQSRRENFGFAFNLKEAKIDFAYDHKSGDKLRKLRSWERSPELKDITTIQGKSVNYTPWSVYEYDKDDSDKIKLHLGEYDLGHTGATYKVKFDSLRSEKELNLDKDPFREASSSNNTNFNTRDQQYNKEENIIYSKNSEDKVATEFSYDQYRLELAFGRTKEENWDREGIYKYNKLEENDAYNIYINESEFAQIELEDKRLNLGYLGEIGLKYNLRYDKYTGGYDTYNGNNNGGDSSLRHQVDLSHKITLLDNTNNHFRDIDFKLNNEFNYFGQLYSYDNGSRNGNSTYNGQVRLKNKDSINQFKDKITLDLGNTTTIYTAGYKQSNDGFDRDVKRGDLYTNNIDFLVNDEKKLNLYYDLDKRFTRGELTPSGYTFDEEYNDLTNNKFGLNYYINESYRFYYDHEKIDYTLMNPQNNNPSKPNNTYSSANEKVSESTYGIEIKNELDIYNITYTQGSDDRVDNNIDTFSIKNDIIGASYLNGGEVEHFYRATYGIYKYGPSQSLKNYSSDQVSFRYEYRDKRFTDEELKSYAAAEYNKDKLEITPAEISRVKQILNERNDNQLDFSLNSIMFEEMNRPEYKKYFTLSLMANINREAYNYSNDFFKSLKELEGDVYGSYKRFGLGYTYREEASFNTNYDRNITKQEHEFRMRAGIGKPSQGWNIKLSYKTEINTDNEYGIYLGKEMGYYEWSVGYTKDYDRRTGSYDDRLAVQFTLLTFPENPLFGIGYKDKDGSMTPNLWLGSGVEVDEPNN
ncbi:MAG: hypothetical protein WBG30_08300 [Psychrilyobacter sp.]|uniref:hypothetical protein n=1 Tax=Psychrilyobacter sp. TaxID=2586924 RepID=UPI003C791918